MDRSLREEGCAGSMVFGAIRRILRRSRGRQLQTYGQVWSYAVLCCADLRLLRKLPTLSAAQEISRLARQLIKELAGHVHVHVDVGRACRVRDRWSGRRDGVPDTAVGHEDLARVADRQH